MAVVVVVGAQWGDEGKGKVVDLYSEHADVVVRYGGGSNAGHTLVVGGDKLTLRVIPSGILRPGVLCLLGQGMVIDPAVLLAEMDALAQRGKLGEGALVVARHAHVVFPYHLLVDELREAGPGALGTTKKGIGPAYEDKAARRGVRFVDLLDPAIARAKIGRALAAWAPTIASLGGATPDADAVHAAVMAQMPRIAPLLVDGPALLHALLEQGKSALLEGAQGTMLDLDHGTYPFVTSSNCTVGGALVGAGLGPRRIDRVIGISKAYATRVGAGPFPTELADATGDLLREVGQEYGSVTRRPRRCGWIDVPALRRAVLLNGLDGIALTKLDVLTALPEVKACVAYEVGGVRTAELPVDDLERAVPVYETMPGWAELPATARSTDELPAPARRYLEALEGWIGCPICLVSIGAERDHTIVREDPWVISGVR
jgi:adenylosuccinate synthase